MARARDIFCMMSLFMQQQQTNSSERNSTNGLRIVREKFGLFNRTNISKFLRDFVLRLKVYDINEQQKMELFEFILVPQLYDIFKELKNISTISWERFEDRI